MSDFDRNVAAFPGTVQQAAIDAGLRAHMIRVYNYMAGGVALTGVVAYFTNAWFGQALYGSPLMYVLIFAPLALVFFLSFRIDKLSASTATGLFFLYAALVGASLSIIFHVYTDASITRVFFISAAAFGGLSLWGYTTKRDLTGMGTFLVMGVFGLIIAMVVNIFLQSSALQFAISSIGVLIFSGLTAYDTQKIKEMYFEGDDVLVAGRKAIMGALTLYLDFINLFTFLLQFLGNRE
jgi:FtsH-binding integral membrane protein